VTGSTYEWTPAARAAGVSEEQLVAVAESESASCFSELEAAVVRFADEVGEAVKGRPATLEVLTALLDVEQVVELIVTISVYGMVARLPEDNRGRSRAVGEAANLIELA
jgi:alkylhydroperoxidase family enzyme